MSFFGNVKMLIGWSRKLDKLEEAMADEQKAAAEGTAYDPAVTLKKALIEAAKSAGSVALLAVLGYLSDNATVTQILHNAGVSTMLTVALIPVIHGIIEGLQNKLKHG